MPGHGHPRGVGERGVELHVVHVHLCLVQVPHVTREGQVEQDGNTIGLQKGRVFALTMGLSIGDFLPKELLLK